MSERPVRWYALAVGRYGEDVRATGTLSLTDWLEPAEVAAVAAGAIGGLNDAAYKAGISGGMPFADGVRLAIVIEYPQPEHACPATHDPEEDSR